MRIMTTPFAAPQNYLTIKFNKLSAGRYSWIQAYCHKVNTIPYSFWAILSFSLRFACQTKESTNLRKELLWTLMPEVTTILQYHKLDISS